MSAARRPPREWLLRGVPAFCECALAALWLVAAGAKLWEPLPAYELAAAAVGGGTPAHLGFAAAVGLEVLLGVAIAARALRGLWSSLALFAGWSLVLLRVRAEWGGTYSCGCFGDTSTVDEALARNAFLAVCVVVVLGWRFLAERMIASD